MARRSSIPEQLRGDIDAGRTADKTPVTDPAASPLGTDEEAAGTPVPPAAAAQAVRDESSRRPKTCHPEPEPPNQRKHRIGIIAALVIVIALGAAVFGLRII